MLIRQCYRCDNGTLIVSLFQMLKLYLDWCFVACRGKYDIVFAIDAAWCLSFEDFKRELEFCRNVITGLGDADIRIGALVYSKVANITFNLGDFSANRKLNALRSISTLFRFVSNEPW